MRSAAALAVLASAVCGLPAAASEPEGEVEFVVLERRADVALTAFARQAGVSVLFPYDEARRIRVNPLIGAYPVEDGLRRLLEGTGLEGELDGGRLTVRFRDAESGGRDGSERHGVLGGVASAIATTLGMDGRRADGHDERGRAFEEIVVTGSRIRRDEFSSRQPATVLGADTIASLAIANVGEALSVLPSNLSSYTPTAKPGGNESYPYNVFNGLYLANLRGLNPTYGSRTLTLVDSRRHVPTNQGDGVDLNMIPLILVDRVEIVTGGASASYGSGAVGGVVNVLLDHDLEGGKVSVDLGRTEVGDGDDTRYGFAWGTSAGERGHLVVGVEGQRLAAVTDCRSRAWCARSAQVRVNPDFAENGEPNYVYRENVRADVTTTGVFPRLGLRFDESGTALLPFETSGRYGVGGDGQSIYADTTLRSDVDRVVAYAGFRQALTDRLGLSVEASTGKVESFTPQDSIDAVHLPLASDNYYLNALPANPCADADPADCVISKDFTADVDAANDTRTDLRRLSIGLRGRIGDSGWSWDAHYQHGQSEMVQAVHDARHAERFNMALDAVDDGAGNPVCRVTRDGFDAVYGPDSSVDARLAEGCVPINVFGHGNISDDAHAYTHGRLLERTSVQQDMVEFVASGGVAEGFGAGDVRAALGLSWRAESIDNRSDPAQPDPIRTDYPSQYGESFAGEVSALEMFGELDVPVTERFALQLAARRSEYENSAGAGTGVAGRSFEYDIDTWKLNGTWGATDALRLRGSVSRDVRAPSFRELYYRKVFPAGSVFGFCSNEWTGEVNEGYFTFTGDPCVLDLRGALNLKPETSDTITFGAVLAPPRMGLRFAADYYRIDIDDAITPASPRLTLERCRIDRDPYFCGLIDGTLLDPDDPLGGYADITRIRPEAGNLRRYRSRGVDLSADWERRFRFGTLSSRLIASRMLEQSIQPSLRSPSLQDVSGVTGNPGGGYDWEPVADWSAMWMTTYEKGRLSLTARARFVDDGKKHQDRTGPGEHGFDPSRPNSIDDNDVPSYLIWSLSGAYELALSDADVHVFGSVRNLFDEDPPLIGSGIAGTNPIHFDTLGRRFRLGFRVSF